MADKMSTRILKEIKNGCKSKLFYFHFDEKGTWGPRSACYIKWKVQDGPHKGEIHIIRIDFLNLSNNKVFPRDPPKVGFVSPILHPHIVGMHICLDILGTHGVKGSKQDWSPIYGVETIFNSIVILLSNTEGYSSDTVNTHYNQRIKTDQYKQVREMIAFKFDNE